MRSLLNAYGPGVSFTLVPLTFKLPEELDDWAAWLKRHPEQVGGLRCLPPLLLGQPVAVLLSWWSTCCPLPRFTSCPFWARALQLTWVLTVSGAPPLQQTGASTATYQPQHAHYQLGTRAHTALSQAPLSPAINRTLACGC